MNENEHKFAKGVLLGVLSTVGIFLIIFAVIAVLTLKNFTMVMPTGTATNAQTQPQDQVSSGIDEVDDPQAIDIDKVSDKLELMQDYVTKTFLFEQDAKACEDSIYEGFVAGLGDEYSEYYDEEEWETFKEDYSGSFGGIGAVITVNDKDECIVLYVYDDTPAQRAGVQVGDVFYKVDGENVLGMDLDVLVQEHVRGEPGTTVKITFLRGEEREEVEMTIERDIIVSPTVASKMLDNNIGYIEVIQFTESTVDDFKEAVDEMIDKGAKGLILDLRDNPGGVFLSAIMMADYIMPDGQIITYTSDKNGKSVQSISSDEHEVTLPIVVMVNENSASASEVFTGALQDSGAAKVVGTHSYGKGIIQNIYQLGDGTGIKLTVDHYFTPKGRDLHGKGITPNVEIELDEQCNYYSDEHDNQLKKAVELLNKDVK